MVKEHQLNQPCVVDYIYTITKSVVKDDDSVVFKKINLVSNYRELICIKRKPQVVMYDEIYKFTYKTTNLSLFIENLSCKNVYESHLQMKLGIRFNTTKANYHKHYSLSSLFEVAFKYHWFV